MRITSEDQPDHDLVMVISCGQIPTTSQHRLQEIVWADVCEKERRRQALVGWHE